MDAAVRAKEIVAAHWNEYVGLLVAMHSADRQYSHKEMLKLCEFHYKTAGTHFYLHSYEDTNNGLFRPRIGEVTQYAPAHPYLHKDDLSPSEVKEIAESVAPAQICVSCGRTYCSNANLNRTECPDFSGVSDGGNSANSSAPPSDEWEGKDLCRRCDYTPCFNSGRQSETETCDMYATRNNRPDLACTKEEAAPLSLSLPSITVEGDLDDVRAKYEEEVKEWQEADRGRIMEAVEAWDVIQVMQTYIERGGHQLNDTVPGWLDMRHKEAPELVQSAHRAMLMKNALRSYYSPEVNERIILSGGREW